MESSMSGYSRPAPASSNPFRQPLGSQFPAQQRPSTGAGYAHESPLSPAPQGNPPYSVTAPYPLLASNCQWDGYDHSKPWESSAQPSETSAQPRNHPGHQNPSDAQMPQQPNWDVGQQDDLSPRQDGQYPQHGDQDRPGAPANYAPYPRSPPHKYGGSIDEPVGPPNNVNDPPASRSQQLGWYETSPATGVDPIYTGAGSLLTANIGIGGFAPQPSTGPPSNYSTPPQPPLRKTETRADQAPQQPYPYYQSSDSSSYSAPALPTQAPPTLFEQLQTTSPVV